MPVHQIPFSRRAFLGHSAAAVAALSLSAQSWAEETPSSEEIVFLSDTHIPKTADVIGLGGANMTANLRHIIDHLCQMPKKPGNVIVAGDCAYLEGFPEEYASFARLLQPVMRAEIPLHLLTGNHDRRETMIEALAVSRPSDPLVSSKFVSVLELANANLFLLDTLLQTTVVAGEVGKAQRTWLARELDARKEKPAIVVAHHHLQFDMPSQGKLVTGLVDTVEFFDLLKSRPHVKAYIFGHTHGWRLQEREGIHLVNLPSTAYVGGKILPIGWVHARLHGEGIDLELKTVDPHHASNGEKKALRWL